MSSIEKLLIRGIRSFDPNQAAVIEFYSPVTLIVGHNGAGKTTIIECLKYATCGDLPPNAAKGGAFVHDPKVAGETEVKGQVKLKFKSVRGQCMVVTRSMQSSVKRGGKIEQKTLEGVLVTTDPITGEQVSVSSRCAELDSEIPVQLGVSRAVLESVIFCHQEDSQWPLSEPSLLKKRFDDIFAATRYTRALEALRSSKKDLLGENKLEQQRLEYLKADKEKAYKLQAIIQASERQIVDCRDSIQRYDCDIEEQHRTIERLSAELGRHSAVFAELECQRHDHRLVVAAIADLISSIGSEMSEPDQVVLRMLEQHSLLSSDHDGQLARVEGCRRQICAQLSLKQNFVNSLLSEKGLILSLIEQVSRKAHILSGQFEELQSSFAVSIPLDSFAVERLESALSKCREDVAKKRHNYEQQVGRSSDLISQINLKKGNLEEAKKMHLRSVEDSRQKLIATIRKLEHLESSEEQVDEVKQRLVEEEVQLNKMNDFLEAGNYSARISDLEQQRGVCEGDILALNHKMSQKSLQAESRARLELKTTERARKSELLSRQSADFNSECSQFGALDESSQIDKMVERALTDREELKTLVQGRLDNAISTHSMLSSKFEHYQKVIAERERLLAQKEGRVSIVTGSQDYKLLLQETEEEYQRLLFEGAANSSQYYSSAIRRIKLSHKCPICERAFASAVDEESTVHRMSTHIDPDHVASHKAALCALESRLNDLRSISAVCDDIDKIKYLELPELAKELGRCQSEREAADCDFAELRAEHTKLQLEERKLQSLKRRADDIGRLGRELRSLDDDILLLECEFPHDDGLSLADIRSRLSLLHDQRRSIGNELDVLSKELKQRQADVQLRSNRFRDLKEELFRMQLAQSEKTNLQQSKCDLEASIKSSESEITKIDHECDAARRMAEEASEKLSHVRFALKQDMEFSESAFEQKRIKVSNFSNLYSEIQSIEDPESRLSAVEAQLLDANNTLDALRMQQSKLDEELLIIKQGAAEMHTRERQLRDNLRIREHRKKAGDLSAMICRSSSNLGDFDAESTQVALQRHQLRLSDLMGERSGVAGEVKQLEEQVSRLQRELAADYPDIEKAYREQLIRVEASQLAAEDLEKYAKALDQAIMRYHASKMDEVNRTLRDLWSAVYMGTDIDTVEIRADQEAVAASATMRSYNYRVVMIKGTVELDMRGRSSAGQRVLTSLLIRLALADTFASHCGILALDEPTTNLDRDNISALADCLADLIRARRQQANFQLLIITHDEEFVEALGRHECAEHYWRVAKDTHQHSVIERQTLSNF